LRNDGPFWGKRGKWICRDGDLVKDGGPFFSRSGGLGLLVEGVTGNQRRGNLASGSWFMML
jgi:hypothetical protein